MRKWSVRRLRRRAASGDKRATRLPQLTEDKDSAKTDSSDSDSAAASPSEPRDDASAKRPLARLSAPASVASASIAAATDAAASIAAASDAAASDAAASDDGGAGNGGVLVFGAGLDAAPAEIAAELCADQDDSTGGEEDEECTGAEDMCNLHPDLLLYKAAAAHNLPVMCQAFALGADKLWVNADDRSRSPVHMAITSGSSMAVEYLLLNGAKINAQDGDGKSPLHMATELGNTGQVCLLLKHRADQHLSDAAGNAPLDLAIRDANADIVTLLRLAQLDEQMKASEHGSGGDVTFNDVVRDFSQLACSHPERLVRSKPDRSAETD